MKRILIVSGLGVVLLAVACANSGGSGENRIEQPHRGWTTIKSPITRRCYEVFTAVGGAGYKSGWGMSEIPCNEHEAFQKR